MRQENEMIEKIISVARQDDSIRAVVRTNILPKREYIHSYEFYFVVNNVSQFEDDLYDTEFGERILLYRADKNYPELFPDTKAHLMVLADGITLVIYAIEKNAFMNRYNRENTFCNVWIGDTFKVILDKDNMLSQVERLEETQTLFEDTPSEEEFLGTCNEFFWILKTFSEYTLRKELPAAMFYLNNPIRDMLNKMIRWHICLKHGTPVDMGILDSNMEKLLEKELFAIYQRTYSSAEYEHLWNSFDAVVELWNKTACSVADNCGFKYPESTQKNMMGFIHELKNI